MMLTTTGEDCSLLQQWADALSPLVVRHPDPKSEPLFELLSGGGRVSLKISIQDATDTSTGRTHGRNPLLISTVLLTYFPGNRLARQWMAAAWAGYLQHEALELVTIEGHGSPLNPHTEPYDTNPWNRGLRDGIPRELTPDSLRRALAVVMDRDVADTLVALSEVS